MFAIEGEQFRAIHKRRGCNLEISKPNLLEFQVSSQFGRAFSVGP
jgi:hypothetical protein